MCGFTTEKFYDLISAYGRNVYRCCCSSCSVRIQLWMLKQQLLLLLAAAAALLLRFVIVHLPPEVFFMQTTVLTANLFITNENALVHQLTVQ